MLYALREVLIIGVGSFIAGAGAGGIVVLQLWRRHLNKCQGC